MPQHHKGERRQFPTRFPAQHFEVYAEIARRKGLSLSDYVVQCMADAHGLTVPEWAKGRDSEPEALPIAS